MRWGERRGPGTDFSPTVFRGGQQEKSARRTGKGLLENGKQEAKWRLCLRKKVGAVSGGPTGSGSCGDWGAAGVQVA